MLHNSSVFSSAKFDSSYKIIGDWKFFIIHLRSDGLYLKKENMSFVLTGGISSNRNSLKKHYDEYLRLLNENIAKKSFYQIYKWKIKLILSNFSFLYECIQNLFKKV